MSYTDGCINDKNLLIISDEYSLANKFLTLNSY